MHQIAEIKAGALNPALHGTKAVELVFGVCRNHDNDDTVDQLTNCTMMAEFALRYWGNGRSRNTEMPCLHRTR